MTHAPFSAAIIGGSVGGLATAIRLRDRLGAKVSIYERSGGQMQVRGAGVVMQPEVAALLHDIGVPVSDVCVRLHERVSLHRNGAQQTFRAPQDMTAWDTLYKTLHRHFAPSYYRPASRLENLQEQENGVALHFADGHRAQADLVVGADGVNSTCRQLLSNAASPAKYSGYLAWRGLERESDLPSNLVGSLQNRFTSWHAPGEQMLCYLVPGADGETAPGKRRVNWVWYRNTSQSKLSAIMTGRSGRTFQSFLPPGEGQSDILSNVKAESERILPETFQNLIEHSELFAQPVQDAELHSRVFGRCVLIGDAAGTVRPHTAAGTSKAFGDAELLSAALVGWSENEALPVNALSKWEEYRLADFSRTAKRGMRLAAQSGLGI